MAKFNKLKGLFVANGMSYKQVGMAIGITERTMQRRMEKGDFYVTEVHKIVDLFNIPDSEVGSYFLPKN